MMHPKRDILTICIQRPVRAAAAVLAGAFLFAHLALALLFAPVCLLLRFWTPPLSAYLVEQAVAGRAPRLVEAVALARLPSYVPKLFISVEDKHFYEHKGIDLDAIQRALRLNRAAGRAAYGGSTITQQLVRTLFLSPDKNYVRKYVEALLALELDLLLPKQRILELYLNEIEMGPGVFGVRAAARHHFGKPPEALSLDEWRRMAAIITNPRRFGVNDLYKWSGPWQRYLFLVEKFT
jgi:penicillin-binding protein 1A